MPGPTYDPETLQKVAKLAARMQSEQEAGRLAPGQQLTAEEMERIGEEVGLSPALMRQALGYLQAEDAAKVRQRQDRKRQAVLGIVACLLFSGAGVIAGYKWFTNSAVFRDATGGRPLFEWPQINVYFQRKGEPTLEEVVEPSANSGTPISQLYPNGSTVMGGAPSPGVQAMDAAAVERYLDWVKRSEAERAKLALRLVNYGQRMRAGLVGSSEQAQRELTEAPVRELREYRSLVESVHPQVPDECRSLYYAYRSAIQKDTREAEALANAVFRWRESDTQRFGYDSTRSVLQRYERPAAELESYLRAQNHSSDAKIVVKEDTCLLRSLNFGLGNF